MKIGIDARLLSDWGGGASRYLENVVRELEQLDRDNEYYLYSNRDFALPFANSRWQKRIRSRIPFLPGTFWLQTEAKRMIARDGLNVFWGPDQALPGGLPKTLGKVLTVLDCVWLRHPETMALYTHLIQRLFAESWIREADRLIVISESTGRDLESLLGVPSSKIQVVPLGVACHYRPRDSTTAAQYIARKFRVSENYICTVGTVEPRKNLITLIRALAMVRKHHHFDAQLLIAGAKGWKDSAIFRTARQAGFTETELKFLGYVPEEDMPLFYSGASLFVFPSLYEGFGLPLLEAMACGVPVVASNVSSIPEVVGDAAVLVSPHRPEDFAEAIHRIRVDREMRSAMIEKGLERARRFRWSETAREILRLFKKLSGIDCGCS